MPGKPHAGCFRCRPDLCGFVALASTQGPIGYENRAGNSTWLDDFDPTSFCEVSPSDEPPMSLYATRFCVKWMGATQMQSNLTRLMIVEDHALFADCLADDLRSAFEVIAVAHTGAEALQHLSYVHPQILLLDLALGVESGFDLVPQIQRLAPGCRIVIVTNFNLAGFHTRARALGIQGFVTKTEPLATLKETIATVLSGGTRFTKPDDEKGLEGEDSRTIPLTRRQYDVLDGLARGLTYKEIALLTGLSENTVDVYLRRLRGAFHAHNSVDLVYLARQRGFLQGKARDQGVIVP